VINHGHGILTLGKFLGRLKSATTFISLGFLLASQEAEINIEKPFNYLTSMVTCVMWYVMLKNATWVSCEL
jgi:hypothetical protein